VVIDSKNGSAFLKKPRRMDELNWTSHDKHCTHTIHDGLANKVIF
jgi:hypothetical protein